MFLHVFLLCFTLQFSLVFAQFGFFEQMFGGHQQQQQRPAGGMGQWQAHSEAGMSSRCSCFSLDEAVSPKWNGNVLISCHTVECSNYLCPDTLVCVSQPSDCPCPDVQDVKCLIPDAQDQGASTVVCVRGQDECADVHREYRRTARSSSLPLNREVCPCWGDWGSGSPELDVRAIADEAIGSRAFNNSGYQLSTCMT